MRLYLRRFDRCPEYQILLKPVQWLCVHEKGQTDTTWNYVRHCYIFWISKVLVNVTMFRSVQGKKFVSYAIFPGKMLKIDEISQQQKLEFAQGWSVMTRLNLSNFPVRSPRAAVRIIHVFYGEYSQLFQPELRVVLTQEKCVICQRHYPSTINISSYSTATTRLTVDIKHYERVF